MQIYVPTKIYSEKNCVVNHGEEFRKTGNKALIVTGKSSSKRNGALEDVTNTLSKQQIDYVIFDRIEENPSVETVMEAAALAIKEQVDMVIGIGGGSPLDAAKAIALMAANPTEGKELLYEKKECETLPVLEVPTTAGTGSEVTPYAILTLHGQKTKKSIAHRIYPKVAFVDAKYLAFAPKRVLINTAIDTLAHLIESYLNTNTNSYNQMFSKRGLEIFARVMSVIEGNETILEEDYWNLMEASTIAGMAITHTGTSLPHAMSYSVTYEKEIPHGHAVGVYLPGYMRLYRDEKQVGTILQLLGFASLDAFEMYIKKVLPVIMATREDIERYTDILMANTAKLANHPYPVTREEIYQLYEKSLTVE